MLFNNHSCANESEVISKFVVSFLLPKLGYDPSLWQQELGRSPHRLDFVVFTAANSSLLDYNVREPAFIIEAKNPKENLDKHRYQLNQYLKHYQAPFGLLTNSKEVRLYKQEGTNIALVFHADTKALDNKISELQQWIGKDSLKNKSGKIMQTIAVYHNKGGVGKTTLAVNIAAALARMNKRVLLIDLDAQANATFATGLIDFEDEKDDYLLKNNIFHLIQSPSKPFAESIYRSKAFNGGQGKYEITVIPAHIDLVERHRDLQSKTQALFQLRQKLDRNSHLYDYVLIDAPPARDLYARIALIAADYLIIPSDLKPFANQGINNVKNYLDKVNNLREKSKVAPLQVLGIVPSRIMNNDKFLTHTFPKQKQQVEKRYGLPIFSTIIRDYAAFAHAFNDHLEKGDHYLPTPKSIFAFYEHHPKDSSTGQAAESIEMLTQELLQKIALSADAHSSKE